MNLNSANRNRYVIQELDDEHVLVSNDALVELKAKLKDVSNRHQRQKTLQLLIVSRCLHKRNMQART